MILKLVRILIGSLGCLRPLCLASIITLVLVLQHQIENCSKTAFAVASEGATDLTGEVLYRCKLQIIFYIKLCCMGVIVSGMILHRKCQKWYFECPGGSLVEVYFYIFTAFY